MIKASLCTLVKLSILLPRVAGKGAISLHYLAYHAMNAIISFHHLWPNYCALGHLNCKYRCSNSQIAVAPVDFAVAFAVKKR